MLQASSEWDFKAILRTSTTIRIKYVWSKLCHNPQYLYGSWDPTTRDSTTLRTRWGHPGDPSWGLFYLHVLTLIPAWISNYMPSNKWDEITYPFLNFNGATVEF